MPQATPPLTWLELGTPLPPSDTAWGPHTDAPGLLAAGGDLSIASLQAAYAQGAFPWFSNDQPILWWSPDPRMVLEPAHFRLHRSLRKTLSRFVHASGCAILFNSAFASVIQHCALTPRQGCTDTWIVPPMRQAYLALHQAGLAHSVETWIDGRLEGGLYCVCLGQAVFGESMFSLRTDASKIALAALVAFCRAHHIEWIDCQQNTPHLASLGARPLERSNFLQKIETARQQTSVEWQFKPLYWQHLLTLPERASDKAS